MRRKTLNIDELGNEVNTERKEMQMNTDYECALEIIRLLKNHDVVTFTLSGVGETRLQTCSLAEGVEMLESALEYFKDAIDEE